MKHYRMTYYDKKWYDIDFYAENDDEAVKKFTERKKTIKANSFLSVWCDWGYSKESNFSGTWNPIEWEKFKN